MNKDLERARREADRKETEKIMKAINEQNKRKQEERLLQEQVNKIKKEKKAKKEVIINFAYVVVTVITIATLLVTLLYFLHKDGEEFVKECTEAGYSENYCMSQL